MKYCRSIVLALSLCTSAVQPGQARNMHLEEKQTQTFTASDKVVSIFSGVLVGAFVGAIIGSAVGNSRAFNGEYVDIGRGMLIGASVMPFLLYEDWARYKGVRYPLNTWYAITGGNITFSNHDATNLRLGYTLGMGRNYHLSERVYLQAEAIANQRRLFFPAQRILFGTPATIQLWHSDIDFSVTYIDIALLTKVRVYSFAKTTVHIAVGPAISVQILEHVNYIISQRDDLEYGSRVAYDFGYVDDEPGATSPYFGLLTTIELDAGKLLLKLSFNRALHASNQIYPLLDGTKLRTLMLSLGYRFSKQ